jgi:hypothetical protein
MRDQVAQYLHHNESFAREFDKNRHEFFSTWSEIDNLLQYTLDLQVMSVQALGKIKQAYYLQFAAQNGRETLALIKPLTNELRLSARRLFAEIAQAKFKGDKDQQI